MRQELGGKKNAIVVCKTRIKGFISRIQNSFCKRSKTFITEQNFRTLGIDTAIRKTEFTEENLAKMINEIINIDVGDNVTFKIEKSEPIRDDDEYG